MGQTTSASVPKVFYTLHVLKPLPVGAGETRICRLVIFSLDLAGTVKAVDEAWSDMNKHARLTARQNPVWATTHLVGKQW